LVKSGEGDTDAAIAVAGMFLGGAIVQSWNLAATSAGVPLGGKIAVVCGFMLLLSGSILCRERD
jgi:hypothetical protein